MRRSVTQGLFLDTCPQSNVCPWWRKVPSIILLSTINFMFVVILGQLTEILFWASFSVVSFVPSGEKASLNIWVDKVYLVNHLGLALLWVAGRLRKSQLHLHQVLCSLWSLHGNNLALLAVNYILHLIYCFKNTKIHKQVLRLLSR